MLIILDPFEDILFLMNLYSNYILIWICDICWCQCHDVLSWYRNYDIFTTNVVSLETSAWDIATLFLYRYMPTQARSVRGGPCGGLSSTLPPPPPWIGRAPAAKFSRYGAVPTASHIFYKNANAISLSLPCLDGVQTSRPLTPWPLRDHLGSHLLVWQNSLMFSI